MKRLGKREIVLLSVMIIALFLFGYYKIWLSPIMDKMAISQTKIDNYNETIMQNNLIKATNIKQKKVLAELKTKFDSSSKVLPQLEKNPEIAYNIKKLGDTASVNIQDIAFSATSIYSDENSTTTNTKSNTATGSDGKATDTSYKLYTVPVKVLAVGEYSTIMQFITSVEKDTRISEVVSINIGKSSKTGISGSLQASISINYYYLETGNSDTLNYDYNNGTYGTSNPFQ